MLKKVSFAVALFGALAVLGASSAAKADFVFSGTATIQIGPDIDPYVDATTQPIFENIVGSSGSFDYGVAEFFGPFKNNSGVPAFLDDFFKVTITVTSPVLTNGPVFIETIGTITNGEGAGVNDYFFVDFPITASEYDVQGGGKLLVSLYDAIILKSGTATLQGQVTFVPEDDGGPVVPEPTSLAILGSGVLGMMGYGLRRRKQAA